MAPPVPIHMPRAHACVYVILHRWESSTPSSQDCQVRNNSHTALVYLGLPAAGHDDQAMYLLQVIYFSKELDVDGFDYLW